MTNKNQIAELRKEIDQPGVGSPMQLRKLAHSLLNKLEATQGGAAEAIRDCLRLKESLKAVTEEIAKEKEHSANFEREANLYHEKCEAAEARIAELEEQKNKSGEHFYKAVQYGAKLEAELAKLKGDVLVMPDDLHPDTKALVLVFASAMAVKLHKAEKKYGYNNSWKSDNWQRECQSDLLVHVNKGDPLDVANYCAFMHYHGWETTRRSRLAKKSASNTNPGQANTTAEATCDDQ